MKWDEPKSQQLLHCVNWLNKQTAKLLVTSLSVIQRAALLAAANDAIAFFTVTNRKS